MNKLLFKHVFAFLFLMIGESAYAQAQRYLTVWLNGGEKVFYDLDEQPKTTFSDNNIVITTNTLTIDYPLDAVLRYTYELKPTGIENNLSTPPIRIVQKDNSLLFENLKQGTNVHLFSSDGKLLLSQVANGCKVVVSLSAYPAGIYITKVNGVTYKMIKR